MTGMVKNPGYFPVAGFLFLKDQISGGPLINFRNGDILIRRSVIGQSDETNLHRSYNDIYFPGKKERMPFLIPVQICKEVFAEEWSLLFF